MKVKVKKSMGGVSVSNSQFLIIYHSCHLCTYLHLHPFNYWFIYLYSHQYVYLSIIHPCAHYLPPICPPICPSIYLLSAHLSLQLFMHPSIHSYILTLEKIDPTTSTHPPSIHPSSTHPTTPLLIQPPIHSSIHSTTLPSFIFLPSSHPHIHLHLSIHQSTCISYWF